MDDRIPHASDLIPHASDLIPHASDLIPHASDLILGPRDAIRYLSSIRVFAGIVIVLFLASMAAGYAIPTYFPETSKTLLSGLQSKADTLAGQSQPKMMQGIFFNNVLAAFIALISGIMAGVFPVFFAVSNGMIIGIVLEMMIAKMGVGGGTTIFLAGILPHGILELPAVLLSTAIGLRLGYAPIASIVAIVKGKDATGELKNIAIELINGLIIFVFLIVPALFLAAIIETYGTSALLEHLVHSPVFK